MASARSGIWALRAQTRHRHRRDECEQVPGALATTRLREAFPWEPAPRYLLRDRDRIFGCEFTKQVKELGIEELLGAPRAPWQRAYIKRVIGTIRRECLDHVIVFSEDGLSHHLRKFTVAALILYTADSLH
jgi:hypothetical protein